MEERAKAEAEKLKSALNFKKMGVPIEKNDAFVTANGGNSAIETPQISRPNW